MSSAPLRNKRASSNGDAPDDVANVQVPPMPQMSTPAQEAFLGIMNIVHNRVPMTGPERDQVGKAMNLVAAELGMIPSAT